MGETKKLKSEETKILKEEVKILESEIKEAKIEKHAAQQKFAQVARKEAIVQNKELQQDRALRTKFVMDGAKMAYMQSIINREGLSLKDARKRLNRMNHKIEKKDRKLIKVMAELKAMKLRIEYCSNDN